MPNCAKHVDSQWTTHSKKCVHSSTALTLCAIQSQEHVGNPQFIHTLTHNTPTGIPHAVLRILQRYIRGFPHIPHPLLLPPLNK